MAKKNAPIDPSPRVTGTHELIALDDIIDDGHNHRIESSQLSAAKRKELQAKIEGLAESMRLEGLLQEILVYRDVRGKLHRIYGARRCAAAKLLGWKKIPAKIMAVIPTPAEIHRIRAIENFEREDLSPAEEALAAWELVEAHAAMMPAGGREAAIEKAANDLKGRKLSWVRDCLYIVDRLTKKTRELLAAAKLNLSQARELATISGHLQEEFAQEIADLLEEGKLTTGEEIRGWIASSQHSLKIVAWDLTVKMDTGVKGCSICLGCPHNTATDMMLFNTGHQGKGADGFCRFTEGYEAKQELTAKVQQRVTGKVKAQLDNKKLDKASAPAAMRKMLPEFVKPEPMEKAVRDWLKISDDSKKPAEPKQPTEKQRRQAALAKWCVAYEEWASAFGQKFDKHVAAKGSLRQAAIMLCACQPAFPSFNQPDPVELERGQVNDTAPAIETPLLPTGARLLSLIEQLAGDGLTSKEEEELWESIVWPPKNFDFHSDVLEFRDMGPELIGAIAKAFAMERPKAPPEFENFLPKDLQAPKPSAREIAAAANFFKVGDVVRCGGGPNEGVVGQVIQVEKGVEVEVRLADGKQVKWPIGELRRPKPSEAVAFSDSVQPAVRG